MGRGGQGSVGRGRCNEERAGRDRKKHRKWKGVKRRRGLSNGREGKGLKGKRNEQRIN